MLGRRPVYKVASGFFDFSINFRRHKNIFILDRFENCCMFWKAMSLNPSFLLSTPFGVRFWYPLSTHPSSRFFWIVFGWVFVRFWTTYGRYTPQGGTPSASRSPKTPGIDVIFPPPPPLKIWSDFIENSQSYGRKENVFFFGTKKKHIWRVVWASPLTPETTHNAVYDHECY